MQITWELFEIANGLKKLASKHQVVFTLKIWSATDHCFQDEISRVDVFFSTAFLETQILLASFFYRKNFSPILLLISSKLGLLTKQYVCCFFIKTCLHSNELISFDYLHSNELISFDYFLNVLFFFSYNILFFFSY